MDVLGQAGAGSQLFELRGAGVRAGVRFFESTAVCGEFRKVDFGDGRSISSKTRGRWKFPKMKFADAGPFFEKPADRAKIGKLNFGDVGVISEKLADC